jgi:aspartate/methionine/tyrosine aminotransferase
MKKVNVEDIFNGKLMEMEPFKAKEILKAHAEDVNKGNIIDMSRGDPSFPPSIEVQKVFSVLTTLVTIIQEDIGQAKSVLWHLEDKPVKNAWKKIKKIFPPEWIELIEKAIQKIHKISNSTQLYIDIIRGLQSTGYGDVGGESEVRATISWYLKEKFKIDIPPQNIILTLGAAEAIGKLFDLLRDPYKLNYLSTFHYIGTISPVYGPYNDIIWSSQVACKPVPLNIDPNTYEPSNKDIEAFKEAIKGKDLRMFILVNPNNPTGRIFSKDTLEKIASLLKPIERCLVVEDIVYADFAKEKFTTISSYLPDKTIIIGSLSKYFRATGNRLGYIAFSEECEKYLNQIFKYTLHGIAKDVYKISQMDFIKYFKIAKSPDPSGALYHTHLCPKVAQYLGMLKLILDDGKIYYQEMKKRWKYFYKNLGMQEMVNSSHNFVPYYCVVDFKSLIEKRKEKFSNLYNAIQNKKITPGQFLTYLAEKGLVVMPAGGFYIPEKEGEINEDKFWIVRFSVANVEMNHIEEAVNIINNSLKELEKIFS